jgi:hypothetical protein
MEMLCKYLDENLRSGHKYSTPDVALPADMEHVDLEGPTTVGAFPFARTLAVLGRTVYLRPTPALLGGALSSSLMTCEGSECGSVQMKSFERDGFALIDGFLSVHALKELREFCEQSTIFHRNYIQVNVLHPFPTKMVCVCLCVCVYVCV